LLGLAWLPVVVAAAPAGLPVNPPKLVAAHTLTNQDGRAVVLPAADGRWQLVFFGYSHCADVCPLTLHKVSTLLGRLGPAAQKVAAAFVSVDSERDSPKRLREYVAQFDARIQGLTGEPETLRAAAAELGVLVRRYQGKTALAYTLQHSSFVYLLDPQGQLRQIYPPAVAVDAMAADLARFVDVAVQEPSHADHMHVH
jgi:protein SCO1/2